MQVTEVGEAKRGWIRNGFFFYKIIWSKLCLLAWVLYYFRYFTVVFTKRTPEPARTNRICSFFHGSIFINYNLSWNITPPLSCCCCYLFLVPWCFELKKKSILYRDVANVNRYTTTKQHVGKYCRCSIGLCPRGNSCQQAQEKVEKRGKIKASGITPYEHSELYNA